MSLFVHYLKYIYYLDITVKRVTQICLKNSIIELVKNNFNESENGLWATENVQENVGSTKQRPFSAFFVIHYFLKNAIAAWKKALPRIKRNFDTLVVGEATAYIFI